MYASPCADDYLMSERGPNMPTRLICHDPDFKRRERVSALIAEVKRHRQTLAAECQLLRRRTTRRKPSPFDSAHTS